MAYALGIDLGTTGLAAAVYEDGGLRVMPLGGAAGPVAPAFTWVPGPDPSTWRSGPAAIADGDGANYGSVVRAAKRDLGLEAPLLIGGVEVRPEDVLAHQLDWLFRSVLAEQAEQPLRITLTHPANWLEVQLAAFRRAVAALDTDRVGHLEEASAAALRFAATHTVPTGHHLVVFDFGGGTTDVAMLVKEPQRFETVGHPLGNPRLGGIDATDELLAHLLRTRPELSGLDSRVEADRRRIDELAELVERAKLALSTDLVADLPLPGAGPNAVIRITRGELNEVLTPLVDEALHLVHETIESAGIPRGKVHGVLVAGGASTMPLVAARIQEVHGLTVFTEKSPKLCVAEGAALFAAATAGISRADVAPADRLTMFPVDLVARQIDGSRDIPHGEATVSEFRRRTRRTAWVPYDDQAGGRIPTVPTPAHTAVEGPVPEPGPDLRLAILAAAVVVMVAIILVALRLLAG